MDAAEKFLEEQPVEHVAAECVAFVSDNQTLSVVEAIARQFFENPVVRDGGSHQALEYLTEAPAPKVLIVDINDSSAPLTAMLSLTAAFSEHTRLIGIGTTNDINLYREMVGAGITDYLVKPVTEKALAAAFCRAEEPPPGVGDTNQPAIDKVNRVTVIGARGGAGASTLAVNLAWILSQENGQRTALVDLDLEYGTIALSLDLEPTRGLREALESPGRIDSLFIDSATAKLTETLSVMATEETLAQRIAFNPEAVEILFESLGRMNECIVVDLPRAAFDLRERVFAASSAIFVVTELTLAGLRDSMRILTGIRDIAEDVPLSVVANRTGGAHQAMSLRDFQHALGHKVEFSIPEDRKAFNHAANNGKPVFQTSRNAAASKVMRRIARSVPVSQPKEQEKQGKGSWLRLLKMG